ncbi:MAG: hypothetical protein RSC56_02000 [Acidaminococcaceae bacterium]
MKKRILMLLAICMVCLSGVCLAAPSNGSVLNAEEKIVDKFIGSLSGAEEYAVISENFAPPLKKALTEAKFMELKRTVNTNLGASKGHKLALVQKFMDGDRIVFAGKFAKKDNVEMIFVFSTTEKQPLMLDFALKPVEPKVEQPAATPAE